MSIYDFTVKAQDGGEVSLEQYKGKVLGRVGGEQLLKKRYAHG